MKDWLTKERRKMASENETVADIANEMRSEWAQVYFSEGSRRKDGEYCDNEFAAIEPETVADRIEAAHQREVGELCGERNGILNANASLADDNDRLRREVAELEREVAELRECLKETMADAVAEYKNNSCFRNVKCGEIERCGTCKVMKWRKALKGAIND